MLIVIYNRSFISNLGTDTDKLFFFIEFSKYFWQYIDIKINGHIAGKRILPIINSKNNLNSSRNTPSTTYYLKETHNTSTTNRPGSPYQNGYPPSDSPNKTIIYKNETQTTNNTYGPNRPKTPEVESFDPKHPPYPYKNKPNEPINIHYSYKSTSKTENNYKGGYPNGETELLLPKKFPTDDGPDGPPKKLDDLMATIGHEVSLFYKFVVNFSYLFPGL